MLVSVRVFSMFYSVTMSISAWEDVKYRTVYILFFSEDELITRTIMRISFRERILARLTAQEISDWIPKPVQFQEWVHMGTYEDKEFIQKMWRICLQCGYVYRSDGILERFLDKMRILVL